MGPHNFSNASIFGGLPDCHNYETWCMPSCTGAFWRHSHMAPVTIASFKDGTSRTIIIGEVLPKYDDYNYWALSNGTYNSTHAPLNWIPEPNDPWSGWSNQNSFRSRHPGGASFACADGHVTFFSASIDRDIYRAISTRAGGELVQIPD